MARYIDADLLIKNIARIEDLRTLNTKTISEAISNTPTADVVEVVHGEWILTRQYKGAKEHKCSICDRKIYTLDENIERDFLYCQCGAKMDGGRKNEL